MLTRSKNDKVIAGVCSGVAKQLHVKVLGVRIVAGILLFAYGLIIPIYLILWLVLESK